MTKRADAPMVLPVDKPPGPTSHDVVGAARRALGLRRIGHTGTLDPFASGLLLLCVGDATRLAEYLVGLPKRYEAVAELGAVTDTDDPTGAVVARSEAWRDLGEDTIRAAFAAQAGRVLQRPPAYSAKKVAGERLYARARRGEAVEPEPVEVTVHELRVTAVEPPRVRFTVECSSGTYIRAIARDAGERLGVGAHLVELRRTGIGAFDVGDAVPLDALDDAGAVRAAAVTPLEALRHLPRVELDAAAEVDVRHGRPVPSPESGVPTGDVALLVRGNRLLAVAEQRDGALQPRKVFARG